MLRAYRANVDEDGVIRLQEQVDLLAGGEVQVILLVEPNAQPAGQAQPPGIYQHKKCLCGCGMENNPRNQKARFNSGHDARARETLRGAETGELSQWHGQCAPMLIDAATNDATLTVYGRNADRILEILEGTVG